MPSTMLALPPAPGARTRTSMTLGSVLAGAAALGVVGALVAAYLALRGTTRPWPPEGATFDTYTLATITVTAVMAGFTIEWASSAVRSQYRGQVLSAFGLTLGLTAAFANLVWYLLSQLPFGPATHPYGTVVHAMLVAVLVYGLIGLGMVVLSGLRAVGNQLTPACMPLIRSAAWFWHATTLAWVVIWTVVFINK
ncbi:MAG: cytochrome c oxidase subunit 3 [Acidimicrobiales bacterium]